MTSFERFALENLRQECRAKVLVFTPPFARLFARGKKTGKAGQAPKKLCLQRELINGNNGLADCVLCPGFARFPISSRPGKRRVLLNTRPLPGWMGACVLIIPAAGPA